MAPASHRERAAASHLRHVCGGEIPAPETSHRQTSDDNSPRSRKRQQEHLVGSAPRAALQQARGERAGSSICYLYKVNDEMCIIFIQDLCAYTAYEDMGSRVKPGVFAFLAN
ncbi:hypothetical protein H8959_008694 [Pygathrix nigripes]